MASIEQAITVLFDPRQPDHIKKSAMDLTELAKQDPLFYKFAIQKILELDPDPKQSLNLYFWYFQALEDQINKSYSSFPAEAHKEVQQFLIQILSSRINILQIHISLLNKFSVLYVRVVQEDFPGSWPDAFSILMQKAFEGTEYTKLFLAVLKTFSEEFTDEIGYLTQSQLVKSNLLKDAMRSTVLEPAAKIWQIILSAQDPLLSSGVLKVISSFISWMPLELTLSFFPYFIEYLKLEATQVPALQCIDGLVNKKMDTQKKVMIIRQLGLIDFIKTFDISKLTMLSDVPRTMAVLIDSLGEHLLDCEENEEIWVVLESGLQCLNNNDPLISGTVFGMFSKFIRILKFRENRCPPLPISQNDLQWVGKIRTVLMIRATLPEFDHVGPENSDEEDQFYKYRAELVDIFKQTLDLPGSKEMVLNELGVYFGNINSGASPERIELLYFLLFHFAEKANDLCSLLQSSNQYTALLEKVISFPIPSKNIVIQMYLENIVRYSTIFNAFPQLFVPALNVFLVNLVNENNEIRKHTIYMLYRLAIKNSSCLLAHVESILSTISQSLKLGGVETVVKDLYKTIGILIGNKKIDPNTQFNLFNNLCDLIVSSLNNLTVTMFAEVLSGFTEKVRPELVPKLSQTVEVVLNQIFSMPGNNETVKIVSLLLQKIIDTLEQAGSSFIYKGIDFIIQFVNLENIESFYGIISNCCHKAKTGLHEFLPIEKIREIFMQIVKNVGCPTETITDNAQISITTRRGFVKTLDILFQFYPDFFNFSEAILIPEYLGAMSCNFIESINPKLSLSLIQKMTEKFCLEIPNHSFSQGLVQVSFKVSLEILVNKKVMQVNPDVVSVAGELVNLHKTLLRIFTKFNSQEELVNSLNQFIKVVDVNLYISTLMSDDKNSALELKKILLKQIELNKS